MFGFGGWPVRCLGLWLYVVQAHCIALHIFALHVIALHSIALLFDIQRFYLLQCIALHNLRLDRIAQRGIAYISIAMLAARLYVTDQHTESDVFKSSPTQNPFEPLKVVFGFRDFVGDAKKACAHTFSCVSRCAF